MLDAGWVTRHHAVCVIWSTRASPALTDADDAVRRSTSLLKRSSGWLEHSLRPDVDALMARHPELSEVEAIELAIRAHPSQSAADRLRALAGHLEIEDISAELRSVDRHT